MKCPQCKIRQLVVITLTVGGEPASLHSCSACDLRWWNSLGGAVALDGVLAKAGASGTTQLAHT